MVRWLRGLPAGRILVGIIVLSGCGCSAAKPSEGVDVLRLDAAQYGQAFDAAVEAARAEGLPALIRDRRGGVIETEARIAGSLLEPWRNDHASFDQLIENTLALQRRRVRFEFSPTGVDRPDDRGGTLTGPDVLGTRQPAVDLTEFEGELELRAWVFVDRAYTPGVRRSTWSRRLTTSANLAAPEGERGIPSGTFWVPMARDPEFGLRLLARVHELVRGPADDE